MTVHLRVVEPGETREAPITGVQLTREMIALLEDRLPLVPPSDCFYRNWTDLLRVISAFRSPS